MGNKQHQGYMMLRYLVRVLPKTAFSLFHAHQISHQTENGKQVIFDYSMLVGISLAGLCISETDDL